MRFPPSELRAVKQLDWFTPFRDFGPVQQRRSGCCPELFLPAPGSDSTQSAIRQFTLKYQVMWPILPFSIDDQFKQVAIESDAFDGMDSSPSTDKPTGQKITGIRHLQPIWITTGASFNSNIPPAANIFLIHQGKSDDQDEERIRNKQNRFWVLGFRFWSRFQH